MVSLDPDGSTKRPTAPLGKVRVANGQFMVLDRKRHSDSDCPSHQSFPATGPGAHTLRLPSTFQGNSVLGSVVISDHPRWRNHMGANVQFTPQRPLGECPHRLDPCNEPLDP